MGKQGPCYHCGVTSTPLWRNGPPEKPVLCNACGSRWRTKGTLVNYTPLHARAEGDDSEDHKVQKMKIPKRKAYQDNFTVKRANLEFNYGFKKALDEDVSNRSSSGSAISNSESCAQFSSADGSELTGPSQSNVWDTTVPSKRRTCVGRPKTSSVEKLTKDLYTILQEQQSSCLSGSSQEDLLYENEMPMISVEIGHGSVLMRDPHSSVREEESEASSLLVESKSSISDAYSRVKPVENRGEKAPSFSSQTIKQEKLKRTKSQTERLQVLGRHSLPLCSIDLKDIFNFDEFIKQFSKEEQEQLMKFLPQVDSIDLPDSLRNMFEGVQFKENFSLFQQLVADGVFETSSSSGSKLEDFKTLMKLALSNPNKSCLLQSYYNLKEHKKGTEDSENPCESLNQNFLETKVVMRSPKQVMKIVSNQETKEMLENRVSSLKPMNFTSSFAGDGSSAAFGYENNDISDQDLLVDVPSNGSFPQAELLYQI